MSIKEVTKNFKTLADYLYNGAIGEERKLGDDEAAVLDKEGAALLKEQSVDMVIAKFSKLANLNILNEKVDFSFFEFLPKIWYYIQFGVEASLSK